MKQLLNTQKVTDKLALTFELTKSKEVLRGLSALFNNRLKKANIAVS